MAYPAAVQFQHSEGQLVNLLRVAIEPALDQGTRQAAAISFKNLVRKDWVAGEGHSLQYMCWRAQAWPPLQRAHLLSTMKLLEVAHLR